MQLYQIRTRIKILKLKMINFIKEAKVSQFLDLDLNHDRMEAITSGMKINGKMSICKTKVLIEHKITIDSQLVKIDNQDLDNNSSSNSYNRR